jgi:hypothetical protein
MKINEKKTKKNESVGMIGVTEGTMIKMRGLTGVTEGH